MVTRREVLQGTVAAAASPAFSASAQLAAEPGWFDKPMRWAQLNSTEDDAAEMDIAFWLDYFKRIHADALCITAGGVVAFYPTKIRYHRPSRWLGTPSRLLPPGSGRLPEARHGRGGPNRPARDLRRCVPRPSGLDRRGCRGAQAPALGDAGHVGDLRAGALQFRVHDRGDEGDRGRFSGGGRRLQQSVGRLRHVLLRALRQEFPGLLRHEPSAHQQSARSRAAELYRLARGAALRTVAIVGQRDPQNQSRGTVYRQLRRCERRSRHARGRRTCAYAVRGPPGPERRDGSWANGKNGKEYRSTMGRKPIGGIFHMGVVAPYRWPDSVQNGNETRIWVLDGVANGLRPWFNKVGASVHDHRWLKVVEDLYVWHWKNERYLRNEEPVARVALVYSQQTTAWYGGPQARQKVEDFSLGMYHALIEARMPFEMLHDRTLETAGRFKLLLLPNIAALSERTVRPDPPIRREWRQRPGDIRDVALR